MTLWPASLQKKVCAVVYTLSVCLVLLSGAGFYSAWQNYRLVQEMEADALHALTGVLLASAIIPLLSCLVLIIFFIHYLNQRVFSPLQMVTMALEQIREGETVLLPLGPHSNDEIDRLSQGVQLLAASMREERRLKAENERLALTDFLTGCLNKRAFYIQAEAELSRAARENASVSFVFADIDNLKLVNDEYGHLAGDEAVKHFAACVGGQCRPYDLIGRFGGDEFVFCFPRTDHQQALIVVARMQEALAGNDLIVSEDQAPVSLCASFGIASCTVGAAYDVEWLIHKADLALYKAKQIGKNCVVSEINE